MDTFTGQVFGYRLASIRGSGNSCERGTQEMFQKMFVKSVQELLVRNQGP